MVLLRTAAEIVGGERQLADRLGISETLLSKFIDDGLPLPDTLFLRAVDIVLSQRHAELSPGVAPQAPPAEDAA